MTRIFFRAALSAALLGPFAAAAKVETSPHNLSAGGPGTVKDAGATQVCAFCHVGHTGMGGAGRALWVPDGPPKIYKLYESSTLQSTLNQPTGASRICLSCHDGTTAPGILRKRGGKKPGGMRVSGKNSLGTDLSDDHPISFVYDGALAAKHGQLADPASLPRTVRLDEAKQVQCTTCHDPHEQGRRSFLRMDDRGGSLCATCHRPTNWAASSHATSNTQVPTTGAGLGGTPLPYATVLDNACESCHRPHSAPRAQRLLRNTQERQVCLVCHDGRGAQRNIDAEVAKPSRHPVETAEWTHDPREDPNTMARHVTCADCHSPHQASAAKASAPAVSGALKGVRGLGSSGSAVPEAANEHEICFKCHGVRDATGPGIVRADAVRNIRLLVAPGNASSHPVTGPATNPVSGGLEPGVVRGASMYCIDCHDNDEYTPGGTRPRGPHGSRYAPILSRNYETNDPTVESFQAYALCYKCHNRDYLINDGARAFQHRVHVVTAQASCAACHDAHGSRRNQRLVNFALTDRNGKPVVGPSLTQRRLEYVSTAPGRGTCYLSCHGKNHEPISYP